MPNLALNLTAAALRWPDRIATRVDQHTLTYAELDAAAGRTATFLAAAGIGPGDRVGLMLPNTAAVPVTYYGILRLGAIVVPMNPLMHAREVEFYLTNTGARALFGTPAFADAAISACAATGAQCWIVDDAELDSITADFSPYGPPAERADSDTAVILHTSGTTGRPKGAELTHGSLGNNQDLTARTLLHLTPDDVVLGCLPLFHVFGMTCGMNAALAAGATLTLLPRFDPATAIDIIRRDGVTVFEGVPTMYSAMLGVADRFPPQATATLRTCVSGGSALPVQVLHDFEKAFEAEILEGYGLSETSPVASFNHPGTQRKPGSIGTPVEGVRMRLVDENGRETLPGVAGEIQVLGPNVMKGYWNQPEATAAAMHDGWFATGDIARRDEDGYYFIIDRKKELIIRGGYNVYPREVEEVLYQHPAVAEAAAVGLPHASLGEEVGAAVVLKAGAQADPDELRRFVKERIAAYKYPRRVWLAESLPKGPTGKILRRAVQRPEFPEFQEK
ncbi:long-chain-fatty-acid--CoA ligase [Nocardia sp. NBC_01327]|uniref:long-chain-fatty-acid--CoA ligase n=1 Tax=Nocardia sp. NBC_01327 TaxID=2903593 RepID=UPI002E14652F|nr:long-chain fatty acid--CoA ligase [Nocardia sp. NBC_01327]